MDTVSYILNEYGLELSSEGPTEIPDTTRANMVQLIRELNFKTGAEIGTAEGTYAETILKGNPQMTLYCVDPWDAYDGYQDYTDLKQLASMEEKARALLEPYPNVRFVKKYSMDALQDFDDGSLDFVYIDANHEDPFVTQDVNGWAKKVRSGGILSGHDYIDIRHPELKMQWRVIEAVNNYVANNDVGGFFIWGTNGKFPGHIRESHRSWMIVVK